MNRRSFLKILGAGASIPIVAKLEAATPISLKPYKPAVAKSNASLVIGNITLKGGYDELQMYWWLRCSIRHRKKEWHHLVRVRGQEVQITALTNNLNGLLRRNNIPSKVSKNQILKAFNG